MMVGAKVNRRRGPADHDRCDLHPRTGVQDTDVKAGRMRPIGDRAIRICKGFLVSVERPSSGDLGSADAAEEHGEETEYKEVGYYQTSLGLSHASASRILLRLLQYRDSCAH